MRQNPTLNHIIELVVHRQLGRSIKELENYLLSNPRLHRDMEKLMAVQNDFKLMTDYWQRGYEDPMREDVYNQLLRRMYVLASNISTHDRINASTFLNSVYTRPRQIRKDWSMGSVRQQLETFVSDVALLELEPEDKREQRRQQVYKEHQLMMNDLFDYILTSRLWNDALAEAFYDMLTTPTIDSIDQQLIVSAITLSALFTFGINKFTILMKVYRNSTDMSVRQKALVGWTLCLDAGKMSIYPELKDMVTEVCKDEKCLDELTELQIQLMYCQDAEEDQRKIHDEIMPGILNGSNIKVTRHGLVEMDEDSLEDILHPDAAERNMEHMEQSMRRMVDMQKQGADIYFGGFRQMKRFPFYNDLSNWFVPFYPQHPAISNIWYNTRGKKFLQTITRVGAFCDSDKYSFVLVFEQVLGQFPAKMLKMIEDGEASPMPLGGEIDIEEQQQPAFVRRMYLQNIYRFFKLFSMRSEFRSPFDDAGVYVFFGNRVFKGSGLQQRITQVASFLMKRKRYEEARAVLGNYVPKQDDYEYYILMGNLLMRMPLEMELSPTEMFRKAMTLQPDSEQALSGYAKASFRFQNYAASLEAYQKLLVINPGNNGYMLNAAICMANMQHNEEALKLLYKLDYLCPDDMKVKRVLAWVLTVSGKYDQASKLFHQLLNTKQPLPVDMLNYGYCLWFAKRVGEAVAYFKQFIRSDHDEDFTLDNEFMHTEHELLTANGISDTEIQLMLDALVL